MAVPMHASSSLEQQVAEQVILARLNADLKLNLIPSKLALSIASHVQLDGLDEQAFCVCEIYAHIGTLRGSQADKVATDLLKMQLVERIKGGSWRKILCFADQTAAKRFIGKSWLAAAAHSLGVEVVVCEVPPETRSAISAAQSRQIMVNAK